MLLRFYDLEITQGQVSKIFSGQRNLTLDQINNIGYKHRLPVMQIVGKHMAKSIDPQILDVLIQAEQNSYKISQGLKQLSTEKAVS